MYYSYTLSSTVLRIDINIRFINSIINQSIMTHVKQFAINQQKHPHTLNTLTKRKEENVNISERICQLIDKYAEQQQGASKAQNG
jgi:hypothetical protein